MADGNTLNDRLFTQISEEEGFRDTAYKPVATEEFYTKGYGNYGKHNKKEGHDDHGGNAGDGTDKEKPKKSGHGCCG